MLPITSPVTMPVTFGVTGPDRSDISILVFGPSLLLDFVATGFNPPDTYQTGSMDLNFLTNVYVTAFTPDPVFGYTDASNNQTLDLNFTTYAYQQAVGSDPAYGPGQYFVAG